MLIIPSDPNDYTLRERAMFENTAGCELGPALTKIGVGGYRATGETAEGMKLQLEAFDKDDKPVPSSKIYQTLIWIVQRREDGKAKFADALDVESFELAETDPKDDSET